MVLKTFDTYNSTVVKAEPLTPEAFASFGGILSADHQIQNVQSSAANYGTAVKIHKVAPIINDYAKCPSGKEATANWNIFRCSIPGHLIESKSEGVFSYASKVLERHPFSTQTFIPMGQDLARKSYLVIVAETDTSTSPSNYPDPASVRAFICRGNQLITYGQGVWHAPMVVVDEKCQHIDFAVLIHENGVENEDVEECYFDPGFRIEYQGNSVDPDI